MKRFGKAKILRRTIHNITEKYKDSSYVGDKQRSDRLEELRYKTLHSTETSREL